MVVKFRQSVKHAQGRDKDHFAAASSILKGNKRQRTSDWSSSEELQKSMAVDMVDDAEERESMLKDMMGAMSEFTMSTSFRGIDAPGTAFLALGMGLCQSLDLGMEHMPRPRNHFAIEWLPASQRELLRHPHQAEHIFGDISDFYEPAVKARLDSIVNEGKINDILVPLIRSGHAMRRSAYCLRRQKICEAMLCVGQKLVHVEFVC